MSEQPVADQEGAGQRRQDLPDRLERLIKPEHRALLVAFRGAADLAGERRAQYAVAETGERPGTPIQNGPSMNKSAK